MTKSKKQGWQRDISWACRHGLHSWSKHWIREPATAYIARCYCRYCPAYKEKKVR